MVESFCTISVCFGFLFGCGFCIARALFDLGTFLGDCIFSKKDNSLSS